MINQFTRSARAAVRAAVDEAERRGDARIGTEHLLLGLLHDADGAAVRAIGVDLDSARRALQAMDVDALAAVGVEVEAVGARPLVPAPAHRRRPFTAAARAVMVRTVGQSQRRRARRLESTDLLLALLDCEPREPAAQLLGRLGVDAAVVRSRLSDAA
jgi:ATP-dependent Clp protease ATP-binding subunit ClpA